MLLSFQAATLWAAGSCTSLSATNLLFGNYTGSALSSTATITVNCTSGYVYTLGLNGGDSGSTTARVMQSYPIQTNLGYGMYQDAAHSTNWGSNNGVDTINGTGTGSNQTYTIYGLLPAGQNEVPGSYEDYPIVYVLNGSYVTFNPEATVPASCTLSANNLSFGVYTGVTVHANSILNVTCTDTTTYNIGLSAGTATGATVTTRAMKGTGANVLAYQLFRDSAYTNNWGMTVGTDTVSGTGTGLNQAITVYGRINAGLYVTPGSYSDTITATVTY